jgi:hypothetical protein
MGLSVLSELDGSEVKSRVQAQQSFGQLVRAAWERRKARSAGHAQGDTPVDETPPAAKAASTAVEVPSGTTGEG